ncbi:MAG: PIN domain-containing protein [Candidatus Bathyarchaeales archaeon]
MKKPSQPQGKNKQTSNAIVFDAHAWVEYTLDGPKAELIAEKLSSIQQALTPATVLGELKEAMLKHKIPRQKISTILHYIKNKSTIVDINAEIAEKAGEINFKNKKQIKDWGMLDSIVYAVAITKKGQVITGDPHFQNLRNVIYIGE